MRWNLRFVVLVLSVGILILGCVPDNGATTSMFEDQEHILIPSDKQMAESSDPLPIPNEPVPTGWREGSVPLGMLADLDKDGREGAQLQVNPKVPSPLPIPVEPRQSQ